MLIAAASVAAMVATGGAAAPLATLVIGSAITYGASNVYEAAEDIQYGLAGDVQSVALNPIQDTIFLGNETAYDTWGMMNTGISLALCSPVASAQMITGEGIKQAIRNFLGSGVSNIARQTISFGGKSLLAAGSGMAVEAAVTPYTSEDAGRLMGLLTGEYVGIKVFGVKTVESKGSAGAKYKITWNKNINATQEVIEGTNIPKSFTINGQSVMGKKYGFMEMQPNIWENL